MRRKFFALASIGAVTFSAYADDTQILEVIPDHLAYLYTVQPSSAPEAAGQLYGDKRRWENGRKLRVCFYNGNPVVTELIRSVAAEWDTHSGVTFDFGPSKTWINCLSPNAGFPEIRIGFSDHGYWSYVGSDSERYGGERAPSMNFQSFNRIYNESQYTVSNVVAKAGAYHKATIKHEFGHALGLLHEHQNPSLNCYEEIKWQGTGNVYDYFAGSPNYWSKDQVNRNIGFVRTTDPDYVAGEADPKSIMMYSLPPAIFKNGANSACAAPVNYDISTKDKSLISKIYPKLSQEQVARSVSESIDAAFVKPAPQFLTEFDSSDYIKRTLVDLESDDAATRRNARTRLAQLLAVTSTSKANELVIGMPSGSYRYKLGIGTAISNATNKIELSDTALGMLEDQSRKETDKTLKNALSRAASNVK